MQEPLPPERDEKWDEKQEEKEEKPAGWGGEEKWQRDPLNTLIWAGVLILGGFILLVENLKIFPALAGRGWSVAFVGAGLLFLVEAALRYLLPEYRRPVAGTLIFAAVLFGIGLSGLGLGVVVWPLIIIAVGVSLLLGALRR